MSKVLLGIAAAGAALIVLNAQVLAGVVITGGSIQTGNGSSQSHVQIVMIQGQQERIEAGEQITLIDADKGTITQLNATTRTYTESVMKPPSAIGTAKGVPKERFEPTGAEQTVAGYKCQVFKASSTTPQGDQTVTGCFSTAVPGWKEYHDLNALLARRTGGDTPELPPGLPLSLETSLKVRYELSPRISPEHRAEMERKVASRPPLVSQDLVTEIKTVPLAPSLFSVPSGYTKLRVAGPIEH